MSITTDQVRKIASLAKLEIAEPELDRFADRFREILDYFAELEAVDTTGVDPLGHALMQPAPSTPFRPDQPLASLDIQEVLKIAVESADDQFRVPKVID